MVDSPPAFKNNVLLLSVAPRCFKHVSCVVVVVVYVIATHRLGRPQANSTTAQLRAIILPFWGWRTAPSHVGR